MWDLLPIQWCRSEPQTSQTILRHLQSSSCKWIRILMQTSPSQTMKSSPMACDCSRGANHRACATIGGCCSNLSVLPKPECDARQWPLSFLQQQSLCGRLHFTMNLSCVGAGYIHDYNFIQRFSVTLQVTVVQSVEIDVTMGKVCLGDWIRFITGVPSKDAQDQTDT